MRNSAKTVVIVGGGTAGWITASLVAAEHRRPEDGTLVVLVESPDIPTVGVGEGTWPSMRSTLQRIGLPESEVIRECDASFKQGTQFIGWSEAGDRHRYVHPFSLPAEYASLNLAGDWIASATDAPFADFVTPQARVIAAGRAPKQASTPDYAFNVNYGYHFDAARFARLLRRHAVGKLGVRHVSANVEHVESSAAGDITALRLSTGESLGGDLFVDCSGQHALLIGRHFGVDIEPIGDFLFNDAAVAVQVPRTGRDEPIASTTLATAAPAGWIWDIGLQSRRGIGHVFSTAHADEAAAVETLTGYVARVSPGVRVADLSFRTIPFEPGYRRKFWVRNCVAIGLSGGFVEPLEASALALIEQGAMMFSRQLPASPEIMAVVARRFNDKMRYHWERVVEFLKLHYFITRRNDSDYWRDCRRPESCPPGLRDKLTLWDQQPPWHDDAPRVDELFPSASYQYVLFGMGFRPKFAENYSKDAAARKDRVDRLLQANSAKARQMLELLPTNRELVNAMLAQPGVAA